MVLGTKRGNLRREPARFKPLTGSECLIILPVGQLPHHLADEKEKRSLHGCWWIKHLKSIVFHQGKSIVFVKSICILNTVDGRNPAPVEVGRFSHYLQGLMDVRLCRISAINSTTLYSRFLLEAIPQGGHHWQSISTLPSDEATQVAADEIDGLMEAEVSLFFSEDFSLYPPVN